MRSIVIALSALIASQRDFRFLLNLGLQLWMQGTVRFIGPLHQ